MVSVTQLRTRENHVTMLHHGALALPSQTRGSGHGELALGVRDLNYLRLYHTLGP